VRGQQELQQFRDHFAGLLQTVAAKEGVCEPLVEDGFPEWIDIHPRAQIHEILTSMPERDRRIMELRFGLTDSRQPQTLEQLGKRFGLSKERVRQLIRRACERARKQYAGILGFD